jgi:hypothetical protein
MKQIQKQYNINRLDESYLEERGRLIQIINNYVGKLKFNKHTKFKAISIMDYVFNALTKNELNNQDIKNDLIAICSLLLACKIF